MNKQRWLAGWLVMAVLTVLLVQTSVANAGNRVAAVNAPQLTATANATATGAGCPLAWRPFTGVSDVAPGERITDLDVVSENDVWAVSHAGNAYAHHWDGQQWVKTYPFGYNDLMYLHGVAAGASSDVWAVGARFLFDPTGTSFAPELAHWDGSSWSSSAIISGFVRGRLFDAAMVSSNNVWVVGQELYSNLWEEESRPWVQHWDGSNWSVVASPDPVTSTNDLLTDIAVVNSNDIWAAGTGWGPSLVVHWNGVSWQAVDFPVAARLFAIAAISSDNVWFVGAAAQGPHIERWDGSGWQNIPLPASIVTNSSLLNSIWVNSPTDIWLAGTRAYEYPLLLHWNGSTWEVAPVVGYESVGRLNAVAMAGPTSGWAVGQDFSDYGAIQQQILRYSNACPPSSPTPTPTLAPGEFYDVPPGSLWYTYVHELALRGVVNGNGRGYFTPNALILRGEFAKVAALGFGVPLNTPAVPTFSDVPASHPFYQYIEAAYAANIVEGLNATQCADIGVASPCYGPQLPIKRGEVAAIIQRSQQYPPVTPITPTFIDVPPSYFAYTAIETLAARNIINGDRCNGQPCFLPNNTIRRGELAKVVYNALQQPTPTVTPTAASSGTLTPATTETATPVSSTATLTPAATATITPTP